VRLNVRNTVSVVLVAEVSTLSDNYLAQMLVLKTQVMNLGFLFEVRNR